MQGPNLYWFQKRAQGHAQLEVEWPKLVAVVKLLEYNFYEDQGGSWEWA
jgi:hypothetical protein